MKTRIRLSILAALLLTALILSACGAAPTEKTVVRIATDATYPPFETVDETSKEMVGFDVDLIKAVAEQAGFEYELVNVNFDPLLAGISQCQYDAAISAITITDERKQSMSFSSGYINAGQIVTINTENTEVKTVADLKGKSIGVQIATTGAIEAGNIEGADVKTYDTVDLAFLDLMNKQVDAVIADYPTSLAFVKANEGKIITTGEPFTQEVYGIAVCKTNTALLDKINAGLKALQDKGTIKELETKWLAGN
jgi:polar amino acid transport system substrate-binding protein